MMSRSIDGDGVDGVDERDGVGAALLGRARRLADVGDVGRQLHDHRHAGVLLAPARDHLDIFRHLADRRAHAALRHAVRAAEIELDRRRRSVSSTCGRMIFQRILGARHHQRDDHGAVGPVALDLLDLAQVDVERPVGDQLDVVEADHALVGGMQRAVARADIHDRRVFAQRLPDHAAPARLEGAHDVVFLVGRRRGGQPERIGRLDADEVGAKVGHVGSPFPAVRYFAPRRVAVDGVGGDLAVLDALHGEIGAAGDAVAAGPDVGERGLHLLVHRDLAVREVQQFLRLAVDRVLHELLADRLEHLVGTGSRRSRRCRSGGRDRRARCARTRSP